MGWTWGYAQYYKNGKVDRKAECDDLYTCEYNGAVSRVLKSAMVGAVYYAAVETVRDGNRTVWAAVCLTSTDKGEFGYKDMDETCGPADCKCPPSILKLLTETESEWANNWRKRCWEYAEMKKREVNFSKFTIGTVISFYTLTDSKHFYKGTKITLEKISKSRWSGMGYRWSTTVIKSYLKGGELTVERRG